MTKGIVTTEQNKIDHEQTKKVVEYVVLNYPFLNAQILLKLFPDNVCKITFHKIVARNNSGD